MKPTPKIVANAWLTANPDSKARIEVLSRVKNRAWGGNPESFVVRKNRFGVVDNPPDLIVVIDLVDKKVFEIEPGYSYNRYDAGKLRFENTIAEYPLSDLIETKEHHQVEKEHHQVESGKLELIDQRFDIYIDDDEDEMDMDDDEDEKVVTGNLYEVQEHMYNNLSGAYSPESLLEECGNSVERATEEIVEGALNGGYLKTDFVQWNAPDGVKRQMTYTELIEGYLQRVQDGEFS